VLELESHARGEPDEVNTLDLQKAQQRYLTGIVTYMPIKALVGGWSG
jgi:hypothetical protein